MSGIRKYNSKIAFGTTPDIDFLEQLSNVGYCSVVDLRNDEEKIPNSIRITSNIFGISYFDVEIRDRRLDLDDLIFFYLLVHKPSCAPVFVFSELISRPLLLLLLFEAINLGAPIEVIYQQAKSFRVPLIDDPVLQEVISLVYSRAAAQAALQKVYRLRPDIELWWPADVKQPKHLGEVK